MTKVFIYGKKKNVNTMDQLPSQTKTKKLNGLSDFVYMKIKTVSKILNLHLKTKVTHKSKIFRLASGGSFCRRSNNYL